MLGPSVPRRGVGSSGSLASESPSLPGWHSDQQGAFQMVADSGSRPGVPWAAAALLRICGLALLLQPGPFYRCLPQPFSNTRLMPPLDTSRAVSLSPCSVTTVNGTCTV